MIFTTKLSTLNIGLMMYGRARWQEAEATRKYFNIVLIRQDKKFFTFELSKVIQHAIPLILHYRTMYSFRTIFFEYIYHIGCAVNLHSIRNSGLIPGGQKSSRGRQTVFFTAVNPMHKNHQDPIELDLTKPRLASYKQKWKVHQDTVYWVDFQLVHRKRLKFYQTRSNAVILYDTLTAYCISKAIMMKSEEVLYQKAYVSPRPPLTISCPDNWTCSLDTDVARSNDIQRIELKPNTQLSTTGKPVTRWRRESLERTKFDRDTLNQEKRDNVTDPTSTERPGHESTERCVLTAKHVENDQTIKERPVTVDQKEHNIDFRVSGLSHAVVKEAERLRVQELEQRIGKSSTSSRTSSRLAAE